MKMKELRIQRTESYQTPANTLVGTVNLVDEGLGAQTIVLSPQSIIKICNLIQAEVQARAMVQARAAGEAMTNAIGELEMIEHPLLSQDE
jgi:hypothetical protein